MPVVDQRPADRQQAERRQMVVRNPASDRRMAWIDQQDAHGPLRFGCGGIWRDGCGGGGARPRPLRDDYAAALLVLAISLMRSVRSRQSWIIWSRAKRRTKMRPASSAASVWVSFHTASISAT